MSAQAPEQTYWNYEPTPARIVRVIVGPCLKETFWHNGLEGTEREAVEVTYGGATFYLDNEDGSGWAKVTKGRGGPDWGHSSLPVDRAWTPILPGLPGGPPYIPSAKTSGDDA